MQLKVCLKKEIQFTIRLEKAISGVNINIESSGLIDKNHKFLACSPDGLVNKNGEMSVIEIRKRTCHSFKQRKMCQISVYNLY